MARVGSEVDPTGLTERERDAIQGLQLLRVQRIGPNYNYAVYAAMGMELEGRYGSAAPWRQRAESHETSRTDAETGAGEYVAQRRRGDV